MKKVLAACLALSLSGCMTTRACVKREHTLVEADNATCKSAITEVNAVWAEAYCRMAISEAQKYAKVTNANTMEIPAFCANAGLDK